MKLGIITCGGSNLTSVVNALRKIGAAPEPLAEPEGSVDLLLMPGVGAFGAAMQKLNDSGFADFFREHVVSGKPAMGICLGMQILFSSSEEAPGVAGLGTLPGAIRKLPNPDSPQLRAPPNIGYNHVDFRCAPHCSARLRNFDQLSGYYYFLHSFALTELAVETDITGTSRFNDQEFFPFVFRNNICGLQFHPERSGPRGLKLLAHCVDMLR